MNPLISNFLLYARFLDLDPDGLDIDRTLAEESRTDPIYADAVAYLGDDFTEVVAHAWSASWRLCERNPSGAPELSGMVTGWWSDLVRDCPALLDFWPDWVPHETVNGMIILKAA